MEQDVEKKIRNAMRSYFRMNLLSQSEVAKRIGVNKQTISNHFTGRRKITEKMARSYSEAFGFDVPFLLTGRGNLLGEEEKPKTGKTISHTDSGLDAFLESLPENPEDAVEVLVEKLKEVNTKMEVYREVALYGMR